MALSVLTVGAMACGSDSATDESPSTTQAPAAGQEIRIGALLSITGPGSSLGTTSEAALELATARWNDRLAQSGEDLRVVLQVENTNLDPDEAVTGFETLADWGAEVIIGPQSSSELAAVEPLATERGVIVVSQGSTASSLAADDNVFRFVPNDRVEGRAMVDLMIEDGIEHIVPIWRDDRGNQGLVDSLGSAATASGLTVLEGVMYEPDTTDFGPTLQEAAPLVTRAVTGSEPSQVAVYLAGFEETAEALAAAASLDLPSGVRWYGGDGSAQAEALITTPGSAEFAVSVGGYPNPLVALPADTSAEDAALIAEIAQISGGEPDAFTLAAYDAFNVAVESIIEAGVGAGVSDLRSTFVSTADGFQGVTGVIELDPTGDRASAPFAFWSICSTAGAAEWAQTASWAPAADPMQPGTITAGSCTAPLS